MVILWRTLFIYLMLLCAMRLMGKRQIGELEVTDLVITLLLSDLATQPIVDPNTPLWYVIVPTVTLLSTEVLLSFLLSRFPRLKNLGSARPSVLIRGGKLDHRELDRLRISADELVSELRQKEITDIRQVEYAILEQNGKISVIPRVDQRPLTPKDMQMTPQEEGIMHIILCRGVINRHNLKLLGYDDNWLHKTLKEQHCKQKEVFLMTVNDLGEVYICKK